MSTPSNTCRQKGCPHPPLGLEWCWGHEGRVQWWGWAGDCWLFCPHVRWSKEALDVRLEKKEVVPQESGRSLVPQSSACRSGGWEAPRMGRTLLCPPVCGAGQRNEPAVLQLPSKVRVWITFTKKNSNAKPKRNTSERGLGFFIAPFSSMGSIFQLGHAEQRAWAAEGKVHLSFHSRGTCNGICRVEVLGFQQ